jgi:hypothetical protein
MSRNHYTKIVHKEQRAQIAHREKELASLVRELHRRVAEPAAAPVTDDGRQRRRTRLETRRLHRPNRDAIAATSQADAASIGVAA